MESVPTESTEQKTAPAVSSHPPISKKRGSAKTLLLATGIALLVIIGFSAFWARPRLAAHYFAEATTMRSAHTPEKDALALAAFKKAAWLGNAEAMNEVGLAYDAGIGVTQNHETAYQWFLRSAEHDNPKGMYSLSLAYIKGSGVVIDRAKAAEWTQKSADAGYPPAEYNISTFYLEGSYSFPRDHTKAMEWAKKAAESGNVNAMFNLALAYLQGDGVEQNPGNALFWFCRAADNGEARSARNAADMYLQDGNKQQGMIYMQKAADLGDSKAMWAVSVDALQEGNDPKALEYSEKCANTGNPGATLFTAYLYAAPFAQIHISVTQRLEKSKTYLNLALQRSGELNDNSRKLIPQVLAWQSQLAEQLSLPQYGVNDLFKAFRAPDGEDAFIGKKIILRGKIEILGDNVVKFVASEGYLIYWFDMLGLSNGDLKSLNKGDEVEVECVFTGTGQRIDDSGDQFAGHEWYFRGISISKL